MTQPTPSQAAEPAERAPSYRDRELHAAMKALRHCCKPNPTARQALEKVERRLKYCLRVIDLWDASHARQAETLIRLGRIEQANTYASLIFDSEQRTAFYERTPIGLDAGADERIAEAEQLGREVLS